LDVVRPIWNSMLYTAARALRHKSDMVETEEMEID
jgi:hypothetical protein